MAKSLAVLGGGESGVGTAVLGKKVGFDVFLSDAGEIKQKYKDVLLNSDIDFEEGEHQQMELILNADVVMKSPGIPDHVPLIAQLKEKQVSIVSEIEFASRYTNAKLIGITGSNGKTTTTSLIYHTLQKAGLNVGLAGNIGKSFALQVAQENYDTYVLELSSFQLDDTKKLKIDLAVLLNITADHMDRYDYNIDNYIASKFKVIGNHDEQSTFVYCMDDDNVMSNFKVKSYLGKALGFSIDKPCDATLINDELKSSLGFSMKVSELKIQGKHNYSNALAAVLVGQSLGLKTDQIAEGLKTFNAIEHRLESVATLKGVEYINDSKATNVDASYFALDAMTKPVVWIVGGVDKGNDYEVLMTLVKEKVKGVICLGTDNEKLIKVFGSEVPKIDCVNSAEAAVKLSAAWAEEGDAVLLSPACASFDLFKNYEDRGNKYKQAINNNH